MRHKILVSLLIGLSGALLGSRCSDQMCLLARGCVGECTDLCLDHGVETDAVYFGAAMLVYIGPETGALTCESFGMRERFHAWSDPLEEPDCNPCFCQDDGYLAITEYQLNRDRACGDPTASDDTWSRLSASRDCNLYDSATSPPTGSVTLLNTSVRNTCRSYRENMVFAPDKGWKTFARACEARRMEYTCTYDDPSKAPPVCTRKPPSPDFHLCVFPDHEDDDEHDEDASTIVCPESYPEKHIFYRGGTMNLRACAECICEPIEGMTYVRTVSMYTDGACSELVQTNSLQSDALTEPDCVPLASPERLGSIRIDTMPLTPETCEVVGEEPPPPGAPPRKIEPKGPMVACCQPSGG